MECDAVWALRSPDLLSQTNAYPSPPSFTSSTEALALLNHRNHLHFIRKTVQQQKSPRLGIYFESLIEGLLQSALGPESVFRGIQIQDPLTQKTKSELDFVYFKRDKNIAFHWETAVKFYLFHPAQNRYLGPSGPDRLDLKLKKVLEHQLPIAQEEFARKAIESATSRSISQVQSQAFIKGILFYPYRPGQRHWWSELPSFLSRMKGTLESSREKRWIMMMKPHWLSPSQNAIEGLSSRDLLESLKNHFQESSRPILLSELEYRSKRWVETSRGFVTPAGWPQTDGPHQS